MNVEIKQIEGVTWMVSGSSGHGYVIDGSPAIGGRNLGPRPMELVLGGLGGCTAMDIISTLKKQRQQVSDCRISLSGTRAETVPKVFTHIHLHYHIHGRGLKESAVKRAVDLSMETYCSVSKMLQASVEITYEYTCHDD
ncbi:MAG: peroxiredoxin [Myxococcales bacterium]|nr:peroxiredoxin [Myxococcales bacterium]|tara:strand:+ start:1058 stop:1474 length:417 start_codon:yes stop_codon:yes gene_type:complete